MAFKEVTMQNWPEIKKLLKLDGYSFVIQAMEEAWKMEKYLQEQLKLMEDKVFIIEATLKHLQSKDAV